MGKELSKKRREHIGQRTKEKGKITRFTKEYDLETKRSRVSSSRNYNEFASSTAKSILTVGVVGAR